MFILRAQYGHEKQDERYLEYTYMTRRIKSCAFTGYRPQKMPWGFNEDDPRCEDFKHRLKDMILVMILEGYRHFISGAAMGTDLWGAQYVLEFKKEFPDLTLEMAILFEGQAEKWSCEYRNLRESVLRSADKITLISHKYTRYRKAREEMKELLTAKANIDRILEKENESAEQRSERKAIL